ncbi:MAG: NADPH:quinone oxidoreductase family protein [Myxococcota bacterium]
MRALLCTRYGTVDDLEVSKVEDPEPGRGELLVGMKSAAVNFPDSLIIAGTYQFKPEPPFSPGGEGVGTVLAAGDGVDASWVGKRVMVWNPFGCMAEKVVLPTANAYPVPDDVSDDVAAALLFGHGTTLYALEQRGQLKTGETLMVFGAAGGTGLAAVQLGKVMGAKVIAVCSTREKAALCREHGADETVALESQDLRSEVKRLTAHQGVDVIYDPVGGKLTELGVRSMAWGGRFLVIGFASGEIPAIPLNLTLLKGCSVVGVFWGAFVAREPEVATANAERLLGMAVRGEIAPHIDRRFPLAQGADAIRHLAERRALGKVLVEIA